MLTWPTPDDGSFPTFPGDRRPADGPDARLTHEVAARVRAGDPAHRQRITVEVQNGVAILSGTVVSSAARRAAVAAALGVPGVRDVCDALAVPDEQAPPAGDLNVFEVLVATPDLKGRRRPAPSATLLLGLLAVIITAAWVFCAVVLSTAVGPVRAIVCGLVATVVAVVCHRGRRSSHQPKRRRPQGLA